ncbi:hypothetical protein BgAZ_401340 [Babesia gibsoni]|uniref:Uncharacterized protein n=1 Tax=Babesia gibsoni TaxID=33632 RepID=A0AAD8LJQ4_BABGI|nr:hypothetical protein BgAZ_401340 [Babesia gibsoni]
MAAVREYLIYGVDDEHKHMWPIHYHLLKNDFLAAIDSIRKGANPMVKDCNGVSAIELCYRMFFKVVNKCVNSTLPLSSKAEKKDATPVVGAGAKKKQESNAVPELHGMADYNMDSNNKDDDDRMTNAQSFTTYVEYLIANHKLVTSSTLQNSLLRRGKGLLAVISAMAERPESLTACKELLLKHIQTLEYPALYASLMEFLFLNSKVYLKKSVPSDDVYAARALWSRAATSDANIKAITEFMSHVAKILEDFCGIFHVDIYSQSLGGCNKVYPGHDRQLQLRGMDVRTIEMLAHMAYVTDKPLLFDVMVLQDYFLQHDGVFRWNDLLSHLVGASSSLKAFRDPLMRRSLRENVGKRMGVPETMPEASVFY